MKNRHTLLSEPSAIARRQAVIDMLRCPKLTLCLFLFAVAHIAVGQTVPSQKEGTVEEVLPSQADPSVQQYDQPNIVLSPDKTSAGAPLALFLPGTGGRPQNAIDLLRTVASQGYRVIGLAYDDEPSLSKVCPQDPDPGCSAKFRDMRTFGRGPAPVDNPPDEAINARLIALLKYLSQKHPDQSWGDYLTTENRPAWDRILVSGLSQGAGMAAFIAKTYPVYRVVLFSSPWDTTGRERRPAPWLSKPSATPPERWYAERHQQENTTKLIANAYSALGIPKDHILIFNGGLGAAQVSVGNNPYHSSTIRNIEYEPQWKVLYGSASSGVPVQAQ